jgi:hypothetical protein
MFLAEHSRVPVPVMNLKKNVISRDSQSKLFIFKKITLT